MLRALLRDADRLIRGDVTSPGELLDGHIDISVESSTRLVLLFGMAAGICIGTYALSEGGFFGLAQLIAAAVKIPGMFIATILVCFPSLYVFSSLFGSRLPPSAVLRLVWSNVAVMVIIFASFGPIVAFFSLSGPSYSFILILNVLVAATAGALGLNFMLQSLDRVIKAHRKAEDEAISMPGGEAEPGSLSPASNETPQTPKKPQNGPLSPNGPVDGTTRWVFRVWVFLFAIVGAQSGWLLRPIVGSPDLPFQLFREKEGSFIVGILNALYGLLD